MNEAAENGARGGWRQAASWAARVAVSAVLLSWLWRQHGRDALSCLSPRTELWVLIGVPLYLGCQLLNALKWQVILDAMGHRVPYRELVRVTLIGMFANFFVPTSVGGDVVRVGLARAWGVSLSLGALSVFTQRVTGLVALLVIGLGGALAAGELDSRLVRGVLVGMALLLLGVLLGAWAGMRFDPEGRRLPRWLARPVGKLAAGLRSLAGSPRQMLWVMVLSFAFQLWQVGLNVLLGGPAGVRARVVDYLWVGPVVALGAMVPAGLGGIGSREAAALVLKPVLGPAYLTWSLLWQAMVLLASLPGGLLMAGSARRRAKPAAEQGV